MAGGKESPRQKMIGMMYLVLTALLALQISNAVLEKFAIINETLREFINSTNQNNANQLQSILKEGGASTSAKIKSAVERAQKIREEATSTVSYIENLKKEMMAEAGATEITEGLISDHSSKVSTMMMDKRKPTGKAFETKLNDYVKNLTELSGIQFKTLARAPKDMPLFASNEDHARKDFLTFTFENTPVIAALASVTQIQTEVLEYEGQALQKLAAEAGAATIRFESVIPMVRPKSSIVAAGAPYEADLFISAASSALSPTMAINQGGADVPVTVEADISGVKMGRIKFNTSGGGYDKDNLAKRVFKAKITLNDSTYEQDIEYYVAKPVIRVTTGSAPTLYMGACNPVNFEVPALGTNYNPSFSPSGATLTKGPKTGSVIITPTQRKVSITVSNAGTTLGTESFDVKPIPLPRVSAQEPSGKPLSQKDGFRAGSLANIRVVAEADANFKDFAPKDANYRIRNFEVILARGNTRVATIPSQPSESIDLGPWRSLMKSGDRIVMDIKKVLRMPCSGSPQEVVVNEIITLPVN